MIYYQITGKKLNKKLITYKNQNYEQPTNDSKSGG